MKEPLIQEDVQPVAASVAETPASADVVKLAGRGTIYITAAKAWFMVTGLAIYLVLPRLLSAEEFGIYGIVVGITSILNAVMVTGTIQTVSKYVSQDVAQAGAVKRTAIRLQAVIGGGGALGYFVLAPVVARGLNDPTLTDYFRLTALITLSYSFYAVFIGYLNGRRQFLRQAMLDASYSTLKMGFVIGLASLSQAVMGALGGWVVAGVCVLLMAIMTTRDKTEGGQIRAADLFKFQTAVLGFTLIINLLQKVDLMLVKALSSPDPARASELAGYYNAVMAIANVTFQSIVAITFVAFPLISEATYSNDAPATRKYISQTMRFSLMITMLLAVLFSSNASGLLDLIYPDEYLAGTEALRIVPFGMMMFGMVAVLTAIISGSGKPGVSLLIGLSTLLVDGALGYVLIPRHGLWGAALATTAAMLIGMSLGAVYVWRSFEALIPMKSLARISLAALVVYFISLPGGNITWGVVGTLAVQTIAFLVLLVLLRELGREEFRAAKVVIGGAMKSKE